MVAVAVVGGAAIAGVAGAAISSSAAKKAAKTQAGATRDAASLEFEQYLQTRKDLQPWRLAGGRALKSLEALSREPLTYGAFQAPAVDESPFVAPTAETLRQDPGYQFRLQEGAKVLERSAAARGGLFSGATGRALTQYSQDVASQEYGNAYGRAFGEHQYAYGQTVDRYNRALGEYQVGFNVNEALRGRQFNEVSALSGVGQTTGVQLAQLGQQSAAGQSAALQAGANATAAGQIGSANAINQGISSVAGAGQSYLQYLTLQDYLSRSTGR